MDPKKRHELQRLEARHRVLAARLAEVGFLTRGSVVSATTTCGQPSCRCHTDPGARHGPYWQWTRKVEGKTHTRRLTEAEAERFGQWIANRRRAEAILEEMEELAHQVAELLKQADQADRPTPQRHSQRKNPG